MKKSMEFPCAVYVCVLSSFSCVQLFVTLWTVARQSPLPMGFSRREYWSGLPFHPPGDLAGPGIQPGSPALAGGFFTTAPPRKPTGLTGGGELQFPLRAVPFPLSWPFSLEHMEHLGY